MDPTVHLRSGSGSGINGKFDACVGGVSIPREIEERFWLRVDRSPDGCWPWMGALQNIGYGVISVGGQMLYAHRVAFALANGDLSDGLLVCHVCDFRSCCRPSHLFSGTHRDNTQDMHRKGRAANDVDAAHAAWRNRTHCKRGHDLGVSNAFYSRRDGSRFCRLCHIDRQHARKAAK
jgi:hypothetical protein